MDALASLLSQAATVMLTGMVLVFLFLSLLVGALSLLARFCAPKPAPADPAVTTAAPSPQVLAAISAAIHQHRAIEGTQQ
ncbi:OadG family transporter subunit [Ferrimonas pelagia]|uniref:OadG family transporter subunit n=1 Tax=Ferrimonas pelagia TaxID=1177826 RepID=UPI0031EF7FA4